MRPSLSSLRRIFKNRWAALILLAMAGSSTGLAEESKVSVGPDLLLGLQKELAQLKAQAEREPASEQPHPSLRIAYLLLAGLAREGTAVQGLIAQEQAKFGLGRQGGRDNRLFQVGPNARVALIDHWIQDKSGSYIQKQATLYVREGNQWKLSGSGTASGATPD